MVLMKSFDDDSHVETRLCQYEALSAREPPKKTLSPPLSLTLSTQKNTHARVEKDIHAIVGARWGLSASRLKGKWDLALELYFARAPAL